MWRGYVSVLQRRLRGAGEVREEGQGSRPAASARGLAFHDAEAVARFKVKRATRVRFLFLFFRKIALRSTVAQSHLPETHSFLAFPLVL